MAATTPTDPVRGGAGTGRAGAWLALAAGAVLCLAGAARLWSVWQAEPARAGLEDIARDPEAPIDPARARQIAEALAAAGRLGPVVVPWSGSDRGASLEALMRERAGDPSALAVQAAALAAAPADPQGWLRLARQRLAAGAPAAAGKALRVSLLAGPIVPGMMLPRLRLALDLYPALDADTQDLVRRQVRFVWMLHAAELPRLLAVAAYRPVIVAALSDATPADMQQFRRVNRLDPLP